MSRGVPPVVPPGSLVEWELSQALDASTAPPGSLPSPGVLTWEKIAAEPTGLVLITRCRVSPIARLPFDTVTQRVNVDSVMGGRVPGTKIVYARTSVESPRDELRRMQFSYTDGVTIYLNGQPLFFRMHPAGLRDDLGLMPTAGGAVYLPLTRGRNELVMAVTEYTGGWAFWARIDGRPSGLRAH